MLLLHYSNTILRITNCFSICVVRKCGFSPLSEVQTERLEKENRNVVRCVRMGAEIRADAVVPVAAHRGCRAEAIVSLSLRSITLPDVGL